MGRDLQLVLHRRGSRRTREVIALSLLNRLDRNDLSVSLVEAFPHGSVGATKRVHENPIKLRRWARGTLNVMDCGARCRSSKRYAVATKRKAEGGGHEETRDSKAARGGRQELASRCARRATAHRSACVHKDPIITLRRATGGIARWPDAGCARRGLRVPLPELLQHLEDLLGVLRHGAAGGCGSAAAQTIDQTKTASP